jgi:hypothetical protein
LELLREHEVALQFLMGLLQKIRQFGAEGSNIVESVQIKMMKGVTVSMH